MVRDLAEFQCALDGILEHKIGKSPSDVYANAISRHTLSLTSIGRHSHVAAFNPVNNV